MTKQALRRLLGTKAFTATAILLLALAIAVSAAIGGLLEAVLLKPLPFRDPESLVWVWASRVDRDKAFFSIPDFLDHEAATRTADLVACSQWDTTLSGRIPCVVARAPGLAPSALREAIREADASVPADIQPLEELLAAALAPRRFQAMVMLFFAGAALFLAATGLYGLTAWSVTQRHREIGVRLALGATASGVVRLVVGEGVRLSLLGLLLGGGLSIAVARALPAVVPGVSAGDARVFAAGPLLLVLVATLSSWIAARRAGGVAPMEALRSG